MYTTTLLYAEINTLQINYTLIIFLKMKDFPGGPVIKTLYFHCRGVGSIPDQGTMILHAEQDGEKEKK